MNVVIVQYPEGLKNHYKDDIGAPKWNYTLEYVDRKSYYILEASEWVIFKYDGDYYQVPKNWTVQW